MSKEYFLGIDVSKGYADFILVDDNQETVEDFIQLDDTTKGRDILEKLVAKYFKLIPGLTIYCGLESTGGYERNWHVHLLSLATRYNLKVARVNPVSIKGISKASLNRSTTDETSAVNIATYLASYKSKIDFSNKSLDLTFQAERSVYTFYKMLVKQDTQLKNQLEKLIYQSTSELLFYCKRGIPLWLLRVLEKYPTAESINKAGASKLVKIKGMSAARASALLKRVEDNKSKLSPEVSFVIKNTVGEILHKKDKIEELEEHMVETYGNHEYVQLLTSIKGIGIPTAILALFEIENINRFRTVKQLVAYFGVNPEFRQSGDGTSGNHMSKKGRKTLRATLYMSSLTGLRWDPVMSQLYKRFRGMGKNHYFAMGVLMHRLLRVIYGVLKSGKRYDVAIDQGNRDRAMEKQKSINEMKKIQIKNNRLKRRRYLEDDNEAAPISGRKDRKLKELETSPSTKSAVVRDHLQPMQK